MTAARAKKGKRSKKLFRLEITRLALAGWCLGLLLALAWMFLLGLLVGKGITPSNINFAEIKKRMVAEGIWPGSSKTSQPETPVRKTRTQKKIPLKDLEFYRELDKKKQAKLQSPTPENTNTQKRTEVKTVTRPAPSPQPGLTVAKQQRPASERYTVQVASFKELESAKKFVSRLKDLNFRTSIRHVDLPGSGRWYRVQVGELSSRKEATALAGRLTKKYRLQAIVMQLD